MKTTEQRLTAIDRRIQALSAEMVRLHLERSDVLQALIQETTDRLNELQGQTGGPVSVPAPQPTVNGKRPYTGRKRGVPKGTPNTLQRKLSNDDVRTIRTEAAAGVSNQRELGERFGVPQATISKIVHHQTYVNVPDDPADDAIDVA